MDLVTGGSIHRRQAVISHMVRDGQIMYTSPHSCNDKIVLTVSCMSTFWPYRQAAIVAAGVFMRLDSKANSLLRRGVAVAASSAAASLALGCIHVPGCVISDGGAGANRARAPRAACSHRAAAGKPCNPVTDESITMS